jgi:hypothetical protein
LPKRRPNEEIFEDGDKAIRFAADFGMLEAVTSFGTDPSIIFSDLSEGNLNPVYTRNVLVSSVIDVDDEPLSEGVKEEFIEDLINRYGLQECALVARLLITHALIGDIKKCGGSMAEQRRLLTELMTDTSSTNIKKVIFYWVAMCAISTALACMITKLYTLSI